jgi:hypothetical protein
LKTNYRLEISESSSWNWCCSDQTRVATGHPLLHRLLPSPTPQNLRHRHTNVVNLYIGCGGHQMGFVPLFVEFGVKFRFLSKCFAITMKRWLKYFLFGTKGVNLFPNMLNLVSNSAFCWNFMQLHDKMVEISYLVATRWVNLFPSMLSLVSNSAFCWTFMQLHERWLKYVIFGAHQMCFGLLLHIELSPKLKLKSGIN